MPEILYEDKYLLLCVKPVGVPSQSDMSGRESLLDELKNRYPAVQLVHRLDTPTGGVMLFSLSDKVTGKLSEMFSTHKELTKQYLAVTKNAPVGFVEDPMLMEDELYHDKIKNKSFVVEKRKGAKHASLNAELRATSDDVRLWLVTLNTGRTHQIRVQFASRQAPLMGDGKYGSREKNCTTALWSYRLAFTHPITGKSIDIISTPPQDDYPWALFSKEI